MFLIANSYSLPILQILRNLLPLSALALFVAGLAADSIVILAAFRNRDWMRKGGERLRKRPWTLQMSMEVVLWILLAWAVMAAITPQGQNPASPPNELDALRFIRETVVLPIVLLAVVAWKLRSMRASWRQAFGLRALRPASCLKKSIIAYLAAMPPAAIGGFFVMEWLKSLGYEIELQQAVRYLGQPDNPIWFTLYMVFLTIVVAPVTEEIFFRGILLPAILKHCRTWLGVAFVSLFFASIHGYIHFTLPLFVMGATFALSYIVTGSLIAPILVHAFFNAVTVIHFLIRDNSQPIDF